MIRKTVSTTPQRLTPALEGPTRPFEVLLSRETFKSYSSQGLEPPAIEMSPGNLKHRLSHLEISQALPLNRATA
jgi:hypothetical protein